MASTRGLVDWRCPKSGKRMWATRKRAKRAARLFAKRFRSKFRCYRCEDCGCWHLATRKERR